ncbi:DUF805 domain-containing protein [Ruegeria arenilitoris]|uniref:DUF805 domain-containing protein n=1 Tax=Ruegeria arenilitoris TaxID=1173585 RepID=UPI00147B7933|nr:DUF805 domain-containing protein [Ruegeria arenilitoris]
MVSAVQKVFSNYATFSGRASRSEYWWWFLALLIFMLILGVLDAFVIAPLLGFQAGDENAGQPLSLLASLAVLLPNLAVGARRLHDTDRSGWWLLIGLIPLIGFLILIYFFVQPSDAEANRFGEAPSWPPSI